jgi:hypothetical protein
MTCWLSLRRTRWGWCLRRRGWCSQQERGARDHACTSGRGCSSPSSRRMTRSAGGGS